MFSVGEHASESSRRRVFAAALITSLPSRKFKLVSRRCSLAVGLQLRPVYVTVYYAACFSLGQTKVIQRCLLSFGLFLN